MASTSGTVEIKTEIPSFTPTTQEMGVVEIKTEMPPYMPSFETRPPPPRRLNLPNAGLLGDRELYLTVCVPLYEASVKGNWEAARAIIGRHGDDVTGCSITENYETALHIAASSKGTKLMVDFVTNLVKRMNPRDLQFQNRKGNTALCLAAASGNIGIAKILVERNRDLLDIPGHHGTMLPLYIASLYRKHDMVRYLYGISDRMRGVNWTDRNRGWVLLKCVEADFHDFTVIHVAEQESLATRLLKAIWHSTVRMTKAEVDSILRGPHDEEPQDGQQATTSDVRPRKYSSRLLFIAAEMGNIKFIVELIRSYPDLIWQVNDNNQSIFHVAVSHRQEGVYNLLYEIGMTDLIAPLTDVDGNNMLHLAAMNPKNKRLQEISGVALQMQRELLWYKEVEGMIPPSYQERKNNAGLLPHELFTKEHKELMSASEKWMKDTASHCMVVAALIATIVFAAAFTVPGGYNQDKGIPIFRQRKAFIIFVISDAISLTFATVSILMFLYILTSRYAEQDFLETLPKKLMKGLATLFLSIVAMMVAFSASFFVLYHNELIWVPKVITLFASTPVILYGRHQYALLADVYRSTYGSKYLFKPKKHMLY
ncbi:putative ankyrin repeat-containing domain, PGG domain, ankyrin repeat-containing domain superfamily [Helianthus annuus]|nr:putative ankyrin repeat-containing domain, PGG domain, ankyrin repeat-containing domain superfamily [Helianthus annuus]